MFESSWRSSLITPLFLMFFSTFMSLDPSIARWLQLKQSHLYMGKHFKLPVFLLSSYMLLPFVLRTITISTYNPNSMISSIFSVFPWRLWFLCNLFSTFCDSSSSNSSSSSSSSHSPSPSPSSSKLIACYLTWSSTSLRFMCKPAFITSTFFLSTFMHFILSFSLYVLNCFHQFPLSHIGHLCMQPCPPSLHKILYLIDYLIFAVCWSGTFVQ